MQYLPFGYQPLTAEQREQQDRKFELYDYYGIPYGMLDNDNDIEISQKEIDREDARLLLMQGKKIPKDLEIRLLRYKQNDQQKVISSLD